MLNSECPSLFAELNTLEYQKYLNKFPEKSQINGYVYRNKATPCIATP